MQWIDVLLAIGLVMILEGFLPALLPEKWVQIVKRFSELSEHKARIMGLALLGAGAAIILLVEYLS